MRVDATRSDHGRSEIAIIRLNHVLTMTNLTFEGIVLGRSTSREIEHGNPKTVRTCDSFRLENNEPIKEHPLVLKFHYEGHP
jgi:hypothetical protein